MGTGSRLAIMECPERLVPPLCRLARRYRKDSLTFSPSGCTPVKIWFKLARFRSNRLQVVTRSFSSSKPRSLVRSPFPNPCCKFTCPGPRILFCCLIVPFTRPLAESLPWITFPVSPAFSTQKPLVLLGRFCEVRPDPYPIHSLPLPL